MSASSQFGISEVLINRMSVNKQICVSGENQVLFEKTCVMMAAYRFRHGVSILIRKNVPHLNCISHLNYRLTKTQHFNLTFPLRLHVIHISGYT